MVPQLPSPPVCTFLDGSLHACAGELAVRIALRETGTRPAAVVVTVERRSRQHQPAQWEFPIRLHGSSVMVGEADATDGEAPWLLGPGGHPGDIDDLFTRSFRLFSVINMERLALVAMGVTPRHLWLVRARRR